MKSPKNVEIRRNRQRTRQKHNTSLKSHKTLKKNREFTKNQRNTKRNARRNNHQRQNGKMAHVLWEIFRKTFSVTKGYKSINPVRRMHLFAKRTRISYKIRLERLDRTDRKAAVQIIKSIAVSTGCRARRVCTQWKKVRRVKRLVCFIHHCHSFEWNTTSASQKGCYHLVADDCCHGSSKACKHGWIRKKPGESKISKPKLLEQYEAIFDYQKQAKDQVDLKVGQSVQVIEKYETGWWLVNTEYEEGYAPGTFLKKSDGLQEEQLFTCNGEKYTCTQTYIAEGPDDHTLNVGAEVEVLQKSMDGWWWVRYNGKIGWAPATCLKASNSSSPCAGKTNVPVEIVSNLSEVSKLLKGKNTPAVSMMTNPMVAPRRPHSIAETDTESNYVSVYESSDYDDDDESHYSLINSVYRRSNSMQPPPRQNSVENLDAPTTNTGGGEKPTKFLTCAEYVDSVGDGISFSAGQEVEVQQKTDSGWYYIKIGNEFGWAPSSYLEEISVDETELQDGKVEEKENEDDDVDADDDDDDEEAVRMSPAKRIQNLLASKGPPSNSPPNSQSNSSLNTSFNDESKLRLTVSPTGSNTSLNSIATSTTSGSSSRRAVKRPNVIPPAPPIRVDLQGGQQPLPSVPPTSLVPNINLQLSPSPSPPPPPPPPPTGPLSASAKKPSVPIPSSTGLSKSGKTSASSPPLPPPPPPTRPGMKPHPAAGVADSPTEKSKDDNSGNLASDLQSRLAKLKANFDSGSSQSSKKQQPLPKEKPVIVHGVNLKGNVTPIPGSNPMSPETKYRPLPPVPKSKENQKSTPIPPASPCIVDNNSFAHSLKDEMQQNPPPPSDVCDPPVTPSKLRAEKFSAFQTKTNEDSNTTPKKSCPNVPMASNCRGLALLQRQKEKFEEEAAAEAKLKASKDKFDPMVSSLRNNFESTPCKSSSNSGAAPNTVQPANSKPAPPTKVPLKPIHKVKPTTIPAKPSPDLPVKPKVSPCKPKLGTVTNGKNKETTANLANKINKFGGSNMASSAKIPTSRTEPPKSQPTKMKELIKSNNDSNSNNNSEREPSPLKKNLEKSPKSTKDRSYKACSVYIAESEGEVSFDKGVDVDVVEKHESGWWLVRIGDQEGWAPSNHIAEVKPLPPSKPLPPNKPLPKPPSSPANKNTIQAANPVIYDSQSETNSPSHQEKNNKNESLNNKNNNNNNINKGSIDSENNFEATEEEAQFVCLSDFSAFEEGEISIEEGMILKVMDSSSTDWWHVMLPSGEDGWAPANCISSVHDV